MSTRHEASSPQRAPTPGHSSAFQRPAFSSARRRFDLSASDTEDHVQDKTGFRRVNGDPKNRDVRPASKTQKQLQSEPDSPVGSKEQADEGTPVVRSIGVQERVEKRQELPQLTAESPAGKPVAKGAPSHRGGVSLTETGWRTLKLLYFALSLVCILVVLRPLWFDSLPYDTQSYTARLLARYFPSLYGGRRGLLFVLKRRKPSRDSFTEASDEGDSSEGDDDEVELPSVEELEHEFFNYTAGHVPSPAPLHDHTAEFNKEIIEVVDGVYVAVGYGLANSVILNGTDGLVVVDTMESTATMQAVWDDWLKLPNSNRPVKAIIYTHFHTDHIFGAAAVATPNVTEVHAYWLTYAEMSKVFTLTAGTTYRRSMRQFGVFVDPEDFMNAGIGPKLHYNNKEEIGTVMPTHIMLQERKTVEVAGLKLQLLHAPGESKDQIVVWMEDKKVLLGADNVYKSLPNIYAIRGTETRDCNDWIASLDLMRSLQAEYLVLGHTRPVYGKSEIASILVAYRDAIQFIHDQTVRYMNKGFYVNDIAHMVKLPPHLAEHPYLQPFYGTVPWAVRAIFTHYMGWYSGNPEDLAVMSTQEKAEFLLSLAGSVDDLMAHALESLRAGQFNWALELASAAHQVDPASEHARLLRIIALRANAAAQTAATGKEGTAGDEARMAAWVMGARERTHIVLLE